jgi:hypothetical protein
MNMHRAARSDPLIYIPLGSYNMKLETVISTYLLLCSEMGYVKIKAPKNLYCHLHFLNLEKKKSVIIVLNQCVCTHNFRNKLWILKKFGTSVVKNISSILSHFNPLKTKRRLLYLKIHFVPRSKHFSSRL